MVTPRKPPPPPSARDADTVAAAIGVSRMTLSKYVRRGCPRLGKWGRKWYYQESAVRQWMADNNLTGANGRPPMHGSRPAPIAPIGPPATSNPKATPKPKAAARPKPSKPPAEAEEITNHSLLEARVRKERALADKHQWAVEVARKEYIHREEARALVAELAAAVRSALLALPGRVSARWAAITDPRELQRELEDTAADILRTWATAAERGAKAEEPEEDAA